jgi:molybdopterin synthase catalytic subunit
MIRVGTERLDVAALTAALVEGDARAGAVAAFVGRVRGDDGLIALTLEHYPGMAEKALAVIEAEARVCWAVLDVVIAHRAGRMDVGEAIVFVGVTAAHRLDAIEAAHYVMDQVKVRGPFWKKEHRADGDRWVEARATDDKAAERWRKA